MNVAAMSRSVQRWNWHGVLIAVAVLFYAATNVWGLTLAVNLRTGFLRGDPYLLLAAHLAVGLVGWFTLLIAGVGLKLVPMFAPAKPLPGWLISSVGGALALGVVTFVAALPLGPGWRWPGALLMALGALGYAGGVMYSFRHRRAGPLDFSVRFAVTAAGVLAAVTVAALSGMAGAWSGREAEAGLTVLFVLAWIGGTILGMLLRILPFMVWLHRFRNRTHKQEKIPFLHEMFHPALGWTTYLCWFAGAALMAAGFAFAAPPLITGGAVVALAGLAAFGWALRQVLYHVPPGTVALYLGRK